MARILRENKESVKTGELGAEEIKALSDPTRIDILKKLGEKPSYPAQISKELDIPKQKAYYHFRILEENGLIEEDHKEEMSGGLATFYTPSKKSFHIDLGGEGTQTAFEPFNEAESFLHPLIDEGDLNGKIVVGSPDEHGPDQVRARDGHLAGDIGLKLGKYAESLGSAVRLDTEIFRSEAFNQNLLMVGGVLTNTVTRKFNDEFAVSFEGESFPYRGIETPESSYTDAKAGVIAKTEHPEAAGKYLYMVAGVQSEGTRSAVQAFKDVDQLFEEGQTYTVIRGRDMDGDGEIDDYEVLEKDE
ncbi:MAG: DNA-binding transcriptional ArsR family regulator [Candidatus Nanohaloarchaea archaeon]|jgi:DNA-binding transcriptional ArsR family regulator